MTATTYLPRGRPGRPPRPRLRPPRRRLDRGADRRVRRAGRRWAACSPPSATSPAGWPASPMPFPPRDDPDDGHPLRRATRREMQQVHRLDEPELRRSSADAAPELAAAAYGYGLFDLGRPSARPDRRPRRRLSRVRLAHALAPGVRASASSRVGNARYAPIYLAGPRGAGPAGRARAGDGPPGRVRGRPTIEARAGVERLLRALGRCSWPTALFAMNVDLDEPLERRRATFERLRGAHGALRPDPNAEPEIIDPAHLSWWLRGERGRVRVDILLDPELPPRVQSLTLVVRAGAAGRARRDRRADRRAARNAGPPGPPTWRSRTPSTGRRSGGRCVRPRPVGVRSTLGPVDRGDGDATGDVAARRASGPARPRARARPRERGADRGRVRAPAPLGGGPGDAERQSRRAQGILTRLKLVPL